MPASPTRTKKALQELAKVFNKLASELTADLNSAINEIDSLKREVQRLKSSAGKTTKASSFQKKTGSAKTNRAMRQNQPMTQAHSSSPMSHSIRLHPPSLLRPETTRYHS